MRLGIALRCQIPQWPRLLVLPASPLQPPPSPLSSSTSLLCLPLLLKTSPLSLGCWQGFLTWMQPEGRWCVPGHAEASRHVMAPQPLLLTETTGEPDGERKKKSKAPPQKYNYCCSVDKLWCVCGTALRLSLKSVECRLSHFWLLLSLLIATDQHQVTPRGMSKPNHATAWTL